MTERNMMAGFLNVLTFLCAVAGICVGAVGFYKNQDAPSVACIIFNTLYLGKRTKGTFVDRNYNE